MARHNYFEAYGYAGNSPTIHITEDYQKGILQLKILRGRRAHDGWDNYRTDNPYFITQDPKLVKQMDEIKPGDIVHIVGFIVTENVNKRSRCPECTDGSGGRTINAEDGMLLYIRPIFIEVREREVEKENCKAALEKYIEISNRAMLVGRLTGDPSIYVENDDGKKLSIVQFPLAVDRKYIITEDAFSSKTDYPMIKYFGKQAEESIGLLKKGETIFVDGALQTRSYLRETTCCNCGCKYTWRDQAAEVIPYTIEYNLKPVMAAFSSEIE